MTPAIDAVFEKQCQHVLLKNALAMEIGVSLQHWSRDSQSFTPHLMSHIALSATPISNVWRRVNL